MCNACPCNPKSTAGGRSKSRDSSDRVRPCGEIAESGDHLRQSPTRSVAIPAIPDFCSLHRPAAVTGLRFGSLRQGPKLQRQRDSDGDSDDNSDGDSDGDSDRNSDGDSDVDSDGDSEGESDGDLDGNSDGNSDG